MAIVIGTNYGYCIMAAVAITVQCMATGIPLGAARRKYKVPYPDNGGGKHAHKLDDETWEKFNRIKRVSDNYMEQVGMVLSMLMLAGLYQPKLAATFGAIYFVGRVFYAHGYINKGPTGRYYGAPFMALSLLGLAVTAGYNAAITTVFA